MVTAVNTYRIRSGGGEVVVEETYDGHEVDEFGHDIPGTGTLLWVNALQGNNCVRITNDSDVTGNLVVKLHLPDGRIVSTDALRVPRGAAPKRYNVSQVRSALAGTLDVLDSTGAKVGTVSGLTIRGPIDYTGLEIAAP